MIITRTPFRVPLGGGGTDLPAYYKEFGGFVFSYAIDKYMYIQLTQPILDDLVRIKYNESETVTNVTQVRHALAREILKRVGRSDAITVVSTADCPAGTGLGSSAAYGVGLFKALYQRRGIARSQAEIAEDAIDIEMNVLGRPIGKQDQYMVALGGLTAIEIAPGGKVTHRSVVVDPTVLPDLENNLMLFYTGVSRGSEDILTEQTEQVARKQTVVVDSMHFIKELGLKILRAVEQGQLDQVGELMHEHWEHKKRISSSMSRAEFDRIYDDARRAGALGGKIVGAGGGGFFLFYVPEKHRQFRARMMEHGLKELRYRFDFEGTTTIFNTHNIPRKW